VNRHGWLGPAIGPLLGACRKRMAVSVPLVATVLALVGLLDRSDLVGATLKLRPAVGVCLPN
jgi:hypothetical protein